MLTDLLLEFFFVKRGKIWSQRYVKLSTEQTFSKDHMKWVGKIPFEVRASIIVYDFPKTLVTLNV